MTQLKVGQPVFLRPINNASRQEREIREEVVLKVERKYFFVGKKGKK